jgi:hypothetical protein
LTVTFAAQQIIEQNGFTVYSAGPPVTGDFTVANVENWIDNAVDFVNAKVRQIRPSFSKIAHMTGIAGSKTISVTDESNAALQPLLSCILRENKKTALSNSSSTGGSSSTGKAVSVNGISMSQNSSVSSAISAASSLNNAGNTIFVKMFEDAILALQTEEMDWNRAII